MSNKKLSSIETVTGFSITGNDLHPEKGCWLCLVKCKASSNDEHQPIAQIHLDSERVAILISFLTRYAEKQKEVLECPNQNQTLLPEQKSMDSPNLQ